MPKFILKNPKTTFILPDLDGNPTIFDSEEDALDALETFNNAEDETPKYKMYFAPKYLQ